MNYSDYTLENLENNKHIMEDIVLSNLIGTKYEPIIDSISGEVIKLEILLEVNIDFLRYFKIHKGIFLDLCEKHDLLHMLTIKHIKNTDFLIENFTLLEEGRNLQFSINISTEDITNKSILKSIKEIRHLQRYQFELLENIPNRVFETDAFKNFESIISSIEGKININDYGSGETNIKRIEILSKFDTFNAIKFDKEMVQYITILNLEDLEKLVKENRKYFTKLFLSKNHSEEEKILLNEFKRNNNISDLLIPSITSNLNKDKTMSLDKKFNTAIWDFTKNKQIIIQEEYDLIIEKLKYSKQKLELTAEFIEDPTKIANFIINNTYINSYQGYGIINPEKDSIINIFSNFEDEISFDNILIAGNNRENLVIENELDLRNLLLYYYFKSNNLINNGYKLLKQYFEVNTFNKYTIEKIEHTPFKDYLISANKSTKELIKVIEDFKKIQGERNKRHRKNVCSDETIRLIKEKEIIAA